MSTTDTASRIAMDTPDDMPSPSSGALSARNSSFIGPAVADKVLRISPSHLKHIQSPVARASSLVDRRTSTPGTLSGTNCSVSLGTYRSSRGGSRKSLSEASLMLAKAKSRSAQRLNDSMVYLDGPQIYTCAQCRTHLTSHDDIISKSFHGRHGRAYLFDQCVNVSIGPSEDRLLITGLHSVCDIFCKRCKGMVGWTYAKAYELSQKYKEGKFIIEKINLHMEESDYYQVSHPAGERPDRWRLRSMSWGSESATTHGNDIVYEYKPFSSSTSTLERLAYSQRSRAGSRRYPSDRAREGDLGCLSSSPLPIAPDL